MKVSERDKKKIHEWLVSLGRKCPICKSDADHLIPCDDITPALPPEATAGKGIDTSYPDEPQVNIKCDNCGFDKMFINLEDIA